MLDKLHGFRKEEIEKARQRQTVFEQQRQSLVERQRLAREHIRRDQELRAIAETKVRQERYSKGLRGFWDKMRGVHAKVKARNEAEAYEAHKRDQAERDRLVQRHLDQRRDLEQRYQRLRAVSSQTRSHLRDEWRRYQEMGEVKAERRVHRPQQIRYRNLY